jgi:hypothetical protein
VAPVASAHAAQNLHGRDCHTKETQRPWILAADEKCKAAGRPTPARGVNGLAPGHEGPPIKSYHEPLKRENCQTIFGSFYNAREAGFRRDVLKVERL